MKAERNAFKAGLFIIICIVLIIGIIVAIKGSERMFQPKQEIVIVFPLTADIGGIRPGDDLRLGGFKVGNIRSIELVDIDDPAKARAAVHASLPRKYVLRKDARPQIQTTFTGQSWINIDSVGKAEPLVGGGELAGRPAAFTEAVNQLAAFGPELRATVAEVREQTIPRVNRSVEKVGEAADGWKQTASSGEKLLSSAQDKVDAIYGKYATFMDRGAEMMVEVRDLFGATKVDFKTAIRNLRESFVTFNTRLPDILKQFEVATVKMQEATDSLSLTLKDASAAMESAKRSMASVQDVLVNNKGKLDGIIDSLKTTSDNLKSTSAEVRRSPWRLLYKPGKEEQENFKVINTARQFADGATELNEAAAALRDALNNPNTDREQVQKLLNQVQSSFQNFDAVEKQLWKEVKP